MALDDYYSANPIEVYSSNQWDVWDPNVAIQFHQMAYWSPLMQYVDLMASPDKITALAYESLAGHVNPNPIGVRQLYVDPMYTDARSKRLTGYKHYGQKVQMHKVEPYLNMWRSGGINDRQYLAHVASGQLGYSVLYTMEHIARNWYLKKALHKHYGPLGQGSSFADIGRDPASAFSLAVLPQIKLRLSVRAQATLQRFGEFSQPIPGRPGQLLAMTTPGVIHDLWTQKNDFMIDLNTLQDPRILLRGSRIDYQGFTFSEGPWDVSLLWNAGRVEMQAPVYRFEAGDPGITTDRVNTGIIAGDGAPDPEVSAVDGYQYVGQGGNKVMHYILVDQRAIGAIDPGDFVSLHTARTLHTGTLGDDYWGIPYGCDWSDGETQVLEVATAEDVTIGAAHYLALSFRKPVTYDYNTVLHNSGATIHIADDTLSSSVTMTAGRHVYAYVTKAQHIHPVVVNAARGAHVFALTEKVTFHNPISVDDFDSMWRQTWDMYGAENVWDPDLYEVFFVSGSFGNRSMGVNY